MIAETDCVVIGAGVAGLTAARRVAEAGHRVLVIEKSRGFGGRCSTRYADPWKFDHGLQYFTARDPHFQRAVNDWVDADAVAAWTPRTIFGAGVREVSSQRATIPSEPWFVGKPAVNAIGVVAADGLQVERTRRVVAITRRQSDDGTAGLEVTCDDDSVIACGAVISSAPAPQTRELVSSASASLASDAETAEYAPCWAVMIGLREASGIDVDAVRFTGNSGDEHDTPIAWMARNDSKPGRDLPDRHEAWVVHATPAWSAAQLELERDEAASALSAEFLRIARSRGASADLLATATVIAHRWRYALVTKPARGGTDFAGDPTKGVIGVGDWCLGGRLEAAWLSGDAGGRAMAAALTR